MELEDEIKFLKKDIECLKKQIELLELKLKCPDRPSNGPVYIPYPTPCPDPPYNQPRWTCESH